MSLIERYGIEIGQIYHPVDGSNVAMEVVDTTTFADCEDVMCKKTIGQVTLLDPIRIDAFRLARGYELCDECND